MEAQRVFCRGGCDAFVPRVFVWTTDRRFVRRMSLVEMLIVLQFGGKQDLVTGFTNRARYKFTFKLQ